MKAMLLREVDGLDVKLEAGDVYELIWRSDLDSWIIDEHWTDGDGGFAWDGKEVLNDWFIFQKIPEQIKEKIINAGHYAAIHKTYRGRDFFTEQGDTLDKALHAVVDVLSGSESGLDD